MQVGAPVYTDPDTRLDLFLTRSNSGGHNYDWQDRHGKTWACGWSAGSKKDAKETALDHLRMALNREPKQ